MNGEGWVFASEFQFFTQTIANGLVLAPGSDGSYIYDLVVNGFNGSGILVKSNDNFIFGSYIGTDVTGASAIPNKNGIEILADGAEVVTSGNIVVGI